MSTSRLIRVGALLIGEAAHDVAWGWPAFKLAVEDEGLTVARATPIRSAALADFKSSTIRFDDIACAQLARQLLGRGVRIDIPPKRVWYVWPGTVDWSGARQLLQWLEDAGVPTRSGIYRTRFLARGSDRTARQSCD